MIQTVEEVIKKRFNSECDKILPMGGGFYGRVFFVEIPCVPFKIVLKLYLFPDIAKKEFLQLKILAENALLKMPEVYFVEEAHASIEFDCLAMEYIQGQNAGLIDLSDIQIKTKNIIAEEIVDNLLAYHRTYNPEGFGALDVNEFYDDWRAYYFSVAKTIFNKAKALNDAGLLSSEVLNIMEIALEHFYDIFYLPIKKASLIHGDYNTWNVMLDDNKEHAVAVIDPFNCCWADSEFDLYQLDNANGKEFGLLDMYMQKQELSENFPIKRAFYELFTELNHYFDAGVEIGRSNIPQQATVLYDRIISYGVLKTKEIKD